MKQSGCPWSREGRTDMLLRDKTKKEAIKSVNSLVASFLDF